jgi:deoxycytidylate deaminase
MNTERQRHCYVNKDSEFSANKFNNFLKKAANVAKKSTMTQKHGCIIVYKNKVVSEAFNTMPTKYQDSLHAEVNAINKIKSHPNILKNSQLFIVRIGPESMAHPLKYSKPCEHCANYINQHKIRKAYYSTNYEHDVCMHTKLLTEYC